ncbi:PWWP domain-containing DNA repair factor 3B-like [Haliotis asinina]|uniref:PWWP domain-containing DNA repair factor 3B-like n=1 Tax=Haliotis asinina TaxID=109174 RepID=UPI003531EF30
MENETDTVPERESYSPGDVVWAKIPNCPWWPAEVIEEDDCPFPLPEFRKKKTVVAVIKFLDEDCYYCINSLDRIKPLLCPYYEEYILKGEKEKRESLRVKFGPAVRLGLQRVGVVSPSKQAPDENSQCQLLSMQSQENDNTNNPQRHDNHTDAQCPETKDSDAENNNIDPGRKHTTSADHQVAETEPKELPRLSRVRRQVQKFVASNPHPHPRVKKGQKRRSMSTGSVAPSQRKIRNCSIDANSPTIPYPSQRLFSLGTAKSSLATRLDVQNSLGVAVKRSLESEYSSTASVNSDSVSAWSVGTQCSLSKGLPNHTHMMTSDGQEEIENEDNGIQDENQGLMFPRHSSSASMYDSNLDSESSESDDELPEGLSPSVVDTSTLPKVRDVVWVKYRQCPFWPAVVRRIQDSRGKKGPKKIQIQFLGNTGHFRENFYVTYRRDRVFPLDHVKRKEFEDAGLMSDNLDLQERFKSSLQEVETYLNRKALGLLPPSKESSFFDDDYESDTNDSMAEEDRSQLQSNIPVNSPEEGSKLATPPAQVVKKSTGKQAHGLHVLSVMKERRKEKNKVLLDFIISEEMKEYLLAIYKGTKKSERHTQYHSSVRERDKLRHSGFGPIADEEQQDEITYKFVEWYKDYAGPTADIDYILDVWIPEAVVYSMIKRRSYGRSRAWEAFNKGCRLFKMEQRQIHQHLIETASNISPADARLYNERLQERMQLHMPT